MKKTRLATGRRLSEVVSCSVETRWKKYPSAVCGRGKISVRPEAKFKNAPSRF